MEEITMRSLTLYEVNWPLVAVFVLAAVALGVLALRRRRKAKGGD